MQNTHQRQSAFARAPDDSASTLSARAPARIAVGAVCACNRQVNELLHAAAYFLNPALSCDDADHGEA
jgi:hypothetical protein